MKSLQAIKSDLNAVVAEFDQHIKLHSNKTAAHADYLEKENQRLKAELNNAKKSRDAYKGLYEKHHKTSMLRKSDIEVLSKNANQMMKEILILKADLRAAKNGII